MRTADAINRGVAASKPVSEPGMTRLINTEDLQQPKTPAILLQARERSAQRLMMAYAIAGLFFMLLSPLSFWPAPQT